MRILHLITVSEAGGAQSVVAEISNAAVKEGHEVIVVSDAGGALWEILDPGVGRIVLPELKKRLDPLADLAAFLAVRRTIRRTRPDVVHLHSSKAGFFGRLFAGRYARRTVYTVHGFDTIAKDHRVFLPLERALAGSCAAIVAVSDYDRHAWAGNGITRSVVTIPNGVSDVLGKAAAGEAGIRLRQARAEGKFVVLSLARLARPKRFDLFAETARSMAGTRAAFFWVGNKEPIPDLPPNLEALGEIPAAASLINDCDVFVLLSDYEGLPMSVLEALSCGKPVVASGVGGIPGAISPGAGLAVGNKAGEVRAALESLMENAEKASRMGQAARARYIEHFSSTAMSRAYLALYSEIGSRNAK